MKKSIFILFLLFSIFSNLTAKEDLIAYWSFDDSTAVDNSGNGYDGTLVNNPTPDIGVKGTCFRFKGKDAYIEVNQNKNLIGDHIIIPRIPFENYSEFTVSMWVNEEKLEFVGGAGYLFFGEVFNAWAGIYHAGHYPDPTLWIKFSTGSINDEDEPLKLDYWPIFNDTWMFYAMVYKNDTLYAYFNGQKIGQKYQPLLISGNRAGIATNWWYYSSEHRQSAAFTGRIDEVKIYKRALTDDEIKKEMDGPDLFFQIPDTTIAIGENLCLPLNFKNNYTLKIPDNASYKILVSMDKSVISPDSSLPGFVINDKRYFEFTGKLNELDSNKLNICGTILPANQPTHPVHFENIVIANFKSKIIKVDGSITITGQIDTCKFWFNYPYFGSTAGLKFVGKAVKIDTGIRLTRTMISDLGGVWYQSPVPIDDNFWTEFSFVFKDGDNYNTDDGSLPGADGMAFVIQSDGSAALGMNGGEIGYGKLRNAIAVEFDTYSNDNQQIENYFDPNGNHIALMASKNGSISAKHLPGYSLAVNDSIFTIHNDSVYYARVEYNNNNKNLKVYLSKTHNFIAPVINYSPIDLSDYFDNQDKSAYIGFTSATGNAAETHILLSWEFCSELPLPTGVERADNITQSPNLIPNPATNYISLHYNKNINVISGIEIMNYQGKTIANYSQNALKNIFNGEGFYFNISKYPIGIYFIKINSIGDTYILKFIKK